jgi:hypothetical protein
MDRSPGWVERLLTRLKVGGMVETTRGTASLVVTICNYDRFQASTDKDETVNGTTKKTDPRQTRDTEQGSKEVKKVSSNELTNGAAYPPPPGVSDDIWSDYRKMRKAKMTKTAYARQLAKLRELADAGYPPGEVVAQSVERGWTGFFELKDAKYGQSTDSLTARALQSIGAIPH